VLLHLVVAVARWFIWPEWIAAACVLIVIGSLFAGISRTRWMLHAKA
jgi:hypothetical protein